MLEQIFAARRAALEAMRSQVSLLELKARSADAEPTRGFVTALRKTDSIAIIAEIKFRAPSVGQLRLFEPVGIIAQGYAEAGADALSILTEPEYFGGRLEFIAEAKQATRLPVLRKDFLFDPYQIYESRAAGADAVLLIAAMLERDVMADLVALSSDLSMDVLLEVHDAADVEKTSSITVPMYGVNHRNLKTLKIDLDISRQLFPMIPDRSVRVAESGIETPEQLMAMRARGADAALIGTSLMRAPSPGDALRNLRKAICGSSSVVS